jgi:hypothetical protein
MRGAHRKIRSVGDPDSIFVAPEDLDRITRVHRSSSNASVGLCLSPGGRFSDGPVGVAEFLRNWLAASPSFRDCLIVCGVVAGGGTVWSLGGV